MTGFATESQSPEHTQGHVETAVNTPDQPNDQPSVDSTDRYGLNAAGKSFLLRRYNVQVSAAGNPYFVPIVSVLKSLTADAENILELARAVHKSDEDRVASADLLADKGSAYFQACIDAAGEGREWLARKRVIWPLTDDLGYQLYKATAGIDDLADFGAYLVNSDGNIQSLSDAQDDERYQKRKFWSDLALAEAGEADAIIQMIDLDTEYNLDAMIAAGYRNQANLDTKNHLRGVRENVPAGGNDVKAQMKAALMDGSNPF